MTDCHRLHRLVMSGFPNIPANPARDTLEVLYRLEDPAEAPRVLVQSSIAPQWRSLPAGFLSPEAGVQTQPLDPFLKRLASGHSYQFRLVANPTRKIETKTGTDGLRRNGRRVDLRREEERRAWLEQRAGALGFTLEYLQISSGWNPMRGFKPQPGRNAHTISVTQVTFEGRLQVTDEDALREAMVRGIGPGKAFGCGLLSLAPLPEAAR